MRNNSQDNKEPPARDALSRCLRAGFCTIVLLSKLRRICGIALLSSLLWGCGAGEDNAAPLIRLADPELIESVDSEHLDILNNRCAVFDAHAEIARLDHNSAWYPFLPSVEFSESVAQSDELIPVDPITTKSDKIVIPPKTGIAFMAPVSPGKRIFIECRGSFERASKCVAYFHQLTSVPELPSGYRPGALGVCMKETGIGKLNPLHVPGDGQTASRTVTLDKDCRAILLMVSAMGEEEGFLKEGRVSYFTSKHEFLQFRQKRKSAHPGLAMNPFIGGILRPSLLLPPRTSIRLREIVVPKDAEFRCSLGVIDDTDRSVVVALNAADSSGAKHEIFRKTMTPPFKGWSDLDCSLEPVSGRSVRLEFSCALGSGESAGMSSPPLVFCGAPVIRSGRPAGRPPISNLVLISLDTLRPDHLGCYGYARPVSPVIDRLAERAILFKRAYSQAPYTLPAHTSLFTSLYPSVHGMHFHDYMPKNIVLLAELLGRHGMATASFNSSGYLSREFGLQRGFDIYCEVDPIGDRYFDGDPFNTNRLADGSAGSLDHALSWIHQRKDETFFLFLHTFMVHDYVPPRHLAEQFNAGCASELEFGKNAISRLKGGGSEKNGLSPEDLDYFINMYDASIRAADDMIGDLLEFLEAEGVLDRTVLVITSDHGEEFLEHGGVRHSHTVYEELLRIPLIMSVPGREGGIEVDSVVNIVDIMPTLLELLGIAYPGPIQGRSFVSLLDGRKSPDRPVFAETQLPARSERFCLIQNGWKYIKGDTDRSLSYPAPSPEQLFNINNDPDETIDVSGDNPDVGKKMKQNLLHLQDDFSRLQKALGVSDSNQSEISEELKERLRQQGYL